VCAAMEVELSICLSQPQGSVACVRSADGRAVSYKAPQELLDTSFPVNDANFSFDRVYGPNTKFSEIYSTQLSEAAKDLMVEARNTVVYTYGAKALPKRQFLYGSSAPAAQSSLAQSLLANIFSHPLGEYVIQIQAYVLGVTENVTDLLNIENVSGVVIDSVKEGPSVCNVTKQQVNSAADAAEALKKVAANAEEVFMEVLDESREKDPFPPYNPSQCVLAILKYPNLEAVENGIESNSCYLISLGDSERPPLCGINLDHLNKYEKTHKSHTALVSVLGAIRCNRLRIPFTKSKLTSLLRRAYNQEKHNLQNELNKPTKSMIFMWVFDDESHAEETYHTLNTAKRICNVMGGAGVGPASRDLSVEKWRLEQDILELKDELAIAKAVHDYKPCIFDQPKPVQNIQEEEFKRITAINKKREEARAKAQADMRAQAQKEAQLIIEQEEKKSNSNLQELEEKLKQKLLVNAELNAERDRKIKEFDKQLDKIRKKKQEEEEKANKLKEEIGAIEEELNARNMAIEKARNQLNVLTQDHTRGRDLILQGREETKDKRQKIFEQRQAQRQQWLASIDESNQKVLEQVRILNKERAAVGIGRIVSADIGEKKIQDDIDKIQSFLPTLLKLDAQEKPATERLRQMMEDYFEKEKVNFERKLVEEDNRKKQLEKDAEVYKARIQEHQMRVKKDQMQEAMKKERHLEGLVEQVIQYLEHGCRMTKIPSKGSARKRYFFIEDRKKFLSCEMDDSGLPVNRKRPTTTVYFKDIKRIILGQYTPAFEQFDGSKKGTKKGADEGLDDDEGSYNPSPTQTITPTNLHKYFYRSFSFEFKKGKTLDVITETDSDFEAWIVAFKRLLGSKSEWEAMQDVKKGKRPDPNAEPPPMIEWGIPLDLTGKPGVDKLSKEEYSLCEKNHITPNQYLNAKTEILQKAQSSFITVYDVRTLSSLDLPRSQEVHEFFLMKKMIASPAEAE